MTNQAKFPTRILIAMCVGSVLVAFVAMSCPDWLDVRDSHVQTWVAMLAASILTPLVHVPMAVWRWKVVPESFQAGPTEVLPLTSVSARKTIAWHTTKVTFVAVLLVATVRGLGWAFPH